ncbi:ROK family transcriptional regulator [Curtobacterium sp. 9128]|uniref:ROK family transcriptional regulator n=1 Tax=Curtobacterium sp. 9128 TaxID=1793722 RepID=UPI0016432068|nr:ROK family transcriptional regulator [Curtobacterium sp. 9128]
MSAGQNGAHVAAHNRAVVLDVVRRDGPVSRSALTQRTGLTAQTVSNIAARLLADGLVRERGAGGDRGVAGAGVARRRLELAPDGCSAVGIHLDPAQVSVVLLDLAGGLLAQRHLGAADLDRPAATLDAMAAAVEDVLAETGVDRTRVVGIGIAAPGPIERDLAALGAPVQLASWSGVPLAAELAARTGLPVRIEKDAVASALAEWWTGSATEDLVSVYLGHGVGAGIVVGGEVVRGSTGNAGEFGAMPVHAHGGWTELWEACQPLQQVRRGVAAGLLADPSEDPASVRAAFERLCAGEAARPLLVEAGGALGSALVHVVELLDVRRVVVGGSTALAGGEPFLDALRTRLRDRLVHGPVPSVVVTALGEDVVARGAACSVLLTTVPSAGGGVVRQIRTGGRARPRDIAHPW